MKALNPNSMIQGRYLIVQSIGKGGMGEVYLAVDQRLGSAVALKRTFFSEDSTLGNAFEREARILARLRHPVLPKVIDHFAENGDQFLVMEHISGDDISKRLEGANKPFPLSWVMFWADQMLDALAYLHSHEPPIVHRDIKPQNLKLTDDNHIVLLDFGLSKDFDSNLSGQGLNSASVAGYSPHFASMEQIRGTGTDARSDLYSLAATLYQMLTNTMPPDALTRADSMLGGEGDPIRPLNELNSEISPAISDVILKAIAIRQDERYSTASEMQKTLRRAFNQDKADIDAKPVMSTSNPQQPPPDLSAPKPASIASAKTEVPEQETMIRLDSPAPLDATLHMDVSQTAEEIRQSDVETVVFSSDDLVDAKVADIAPPPRAQAETPKPLKGAPASKAKSSKFGLVVGILVGLLLLGGIAGGAGWYLLKRGNGLTIPVPSPTPLPVALPSQLPNANILVETDPNIDVNSNTNSNSNAIANTALGGDSISNVNSSNAAQVSGPTPGASTRPTPLPSQPSTPRETLPRPPQSPTVKTTPKPKTTHNPTVIDQ